MGWCRAFAQLLKDFIHKTDKGCSGNAMTKMHLQYRAKSVNLTNQTRNITIGSPKQIANFAS
jgi:hypothetical protein